ncbi:MAG: acyl-CoA dehydrogenase [Sphingorhabdus sp.]
MRTFDRDDLFFQLFDVAKIEDILHGETGQELDRSIIENLLDTAQQLAADHFEPSAKKADEIEPDFVDGKVVMIPEAQTAIDAYIQAGFMGSGFEPEHGGLGLPESVIQGLFFVLASANVSYTGYGLLTTAAGRLLAKFASKEQRQRYLIPMVEGRYFATMCLSEPHAGSSLADITTTATPSDDGTYKISGSKMWISSGDHELSENIVHLVMAKIPGGPAGVKGISLFIVPKYRLNSDGSPGEANDVTLAGLNHKMGYRGITNCALNFGDNDDCIGHLVGAEHQGLTFMFHMMNEARIYVGLGATALGQAGFQASLDYARGRPQGRHPGDKDARSTPVPIVEHADIRRLLLAQKSSVEPSLALGLYCAKLVDIVRSRSDPSAVDRAKLLLEMLTPITKSWPSEFCLEANKHALQILGGAGYTRDYPIERYYRDNRLNPIHEGTHGIQGLDFLGRKARMLDGKGLALLCSEIQQTITNMHNVDGAEYFTRRLSERVEEFQSVSGSLTDAVSEDAKTGLANATLYLDYAGHMVIAWMHLRILEATLTSEQSEAFIKGKWQSAKYFYARELSRTAKWAETLRTNDQSAAQMRDEWF